MRARAEARAEGEEAARRGVAEQVAGESEAVAWAAAVAWAVVEVSAVVESAVGESAAAESVAGESAAAVVSTRGPTPV